MVRYVVPIVANLESNVCRFFFLSVIVRRLRTEGEGGQAGRGGDDKGTEPRCRE